MTMFKFIIVDGKYFSWQFVVYFFFFLILAVLVDGFIKTIRLRFRFSNKAESENNK
jgi:hypothetical protein